MENEDTTELLLENNQSANTFSNINSTSNSTELNEDQKFVFELDFTNEPDFNMDLRSDRKTENVEDLSTIEREEKFPSLKSEGHENSTTEDTENNSNINHFPHISVKTADKINSTVISRSSVENSGSKSVLINQLPNGSVDLGNSRLMNKYPSNFSIASLLNSSSNLPGQNKRSINHTSNTVEVIIIDDDSSDRDMPSKRRKIGLTETQNSIYNYGENVSSNSEIANKSAYNGSIHSSTNSAEYIDMDEHLRNNFNSIRNFTQPPLTAVPTHALNDNYSKPFSHNIHNTNYFVPNANPAHSLKVNHNPYIHTSNIQSTVSNINQNNSTSNRYQNMYLPSMSYQNQTSNAAPSCNTNNNYNGRFNVTPYQTTKHNTNYPIHTNSTTRNDYLSQHNKTQQYPTHYRNLPPKNLLFHTSLNPESNTTNLHQNMSSQSCIGARPMCNENKDANTGRIANSLQNSTAIISQLQKEFSLNEKRVCSSDTQSTTIEHEEQCSDQKDFIDENIDNNRPASRTSQTSSSTSNSNAESAEGSTDST
ncbi:hypothetical protein CBL_21197, partial [Carabus blaptoides fortunei]